MSEPTEPRDGSDAGAADWSSTNLWDFAVSVYVHDPVQRVSLSLQDTLGADVNLILYCLWLGATGRGQIDGDNFATLSEAVSVWHKQVIVPLRAARRQLGDPPARVSPSAAKALRASVKDNELAAERIELDMLEDALDRSPVAHDIERRKRDMQNSLTAYFEFMGVPGSEDLDDAIATLIDACFSA